MIAALGATLLARAAVQAAPLFPATYYRMPSPTPAAIAVGDVNQDGWPDLVVASGAGALVRLGTGGGSFAPAVTYAAGVGPDAVALGDLNGDGKLDIAVANGASNTVSVLLGNGDGSFGPHADFAAGSGPSGLVAADLNGDGRLDLAVTNRNDNTVSVLLGAGGGSFIAAGTYATGSSPSSVAAGDLNGDGARDLVVANQTTDLNGSVSVLLGHGDGTFQPATAYPTGWEPTTVVLTDLNGDGKLDVVTSNLYGGGSPFAPVGNVSVLLGVGDGTLAAHVDYAVSETVRSVAVGDLNNDGRPDVVVTNGRGSRGEPSISVLLGNGDGTLGPRLATGLSTIEPGVVAMGDLNQDGRQDIVLADLGFMLGGSPGLCVWLGNGNGSLGQHGTDYAMSTGASWIALGDLNRDGRPDVACGSSTHASVAVRLNHGNGTLDPEIHTALGSNVQSLATGDLNEDGRLDLVVVNPPSVSVLRGRGDGTFDPPLNQALPSGSWFGVAVGDLNGDGHADVAVAGSDAGYGHGEVALFFGTGAGGLVAGPTLQVGGYEMHSVALADLNRDGRTDVIAADYYGDAVSAWLATGPGTFAAPQTYPAGGDVLGLAIGDFTRDGLPDVVSASGPSGPGTGQLSLFRGLGDGSLGPRTDDPAGITTQFIAIGDLDGDGALDALVTNGGSGSVTQFLGHGNGTFGEALEYGMGAGFIVTGDLDGDGAPDLVMGAINHVTVFHNQAPQIPTAVEISAEAPVVTPTSVALRWRVAGATSALAVDRTEEGGAWTRLGDVVAGADGIASYLDRAVAPGGRYGYRLVSGGATGGEVWVTVPASLELALEGAQPNPSFGPPSVAFSLPDGAPAELALLDVAGRVVATQPVGSLGAGRHVVALGAASLRSGVYWVRLTRGSRTLRTKTAIVR